MKDEMTTKKTKKANSTKRGSDADLFSVSGASVALNRARRTVERALFNVPPAEIRSGLKVWHMRTIIEAINANTNAPITPSGGVATAPASQTANYDLARSRATLAQQQALKAGIEAGILSGQYWKAETVQKVWSEGFFVHRERMLSIPGAVADKLTFFTMEDRAAVELILRDVVYEALENLSDPDWMEREMAARGKRRYVPSPVRPPNDDPNRRRDRHHPERRRHRDEASVGTSRRIGGNLDHGSCAIGGGAQGKPQIDLGHRRLARTDRGIFAV
jgi:hypothetical protein